MPLFAIFFWSVALMLSIAIFVAGYVLQSISLFDISKRRGIQSPWLSWIPVGNSMILGAIADDYRAKWGQKDVRFRATTPLAAAVVLVGSAVRTALLLSLAVVAMVLVEAREDEFALIVMILAMFLLLGLSLVIRLCSLAHTALVFVGNYYLYASCEPQRKLLYLLISIAIGVLVLKIPTLGGVVFLFLCRKKDLGMPEKA